MTATAALKPLPTRDLAAAPGAIVLARHGEPALSRRVRLDAAGYRRWWASYEEGGLLHGQTPPSGLVQAARAAGVVFCSVRRRSVETARAVVGPDHFRSDPIFVEAPLPPPSLPRWLKLSPRTWGVIARSAWWFFGHHDGQETRTRATARAREAASRLIEAAEGGQDVLLLAHGFFNAMIGRELKARGWRRVSTGGYRYWCAQRFEQG
ncbi:MAG: histidine phosphatase family protein [Proteobacteria bacterium]|nr:histidine phosphatase family protein [Pseudomonadota bacterium]